MFINSPLAAVCNTVVWLLAQTSPPSMTLQQGQSAYQQDHGKMQSFINLTRSTIDQRVSTASTNQKRQGCLISISFNPTFCSNQTSLRFHRIPRPEIRPIFPEIPRARAHNTQHRRMFVSSTSLNLDLRQKGVKRSHRLHSSNMLVFFNPLET